MQVFVDAMALGKGAYAIHQSGKWYTNENFGKYSLVYDIRGKRDRQEHCIAMIQCSCSKLL